MVPAMKRAAASVGVTGMHMRIGIHSGPITAGVLRTEKGRFQMFGDTMNTASRVRAVVLCVVCALILMRHPLVSRRWRARAFLGGYRRLKPRRRFCATCLASC
jgi:class 3 adenylate cyclase